MVSLVALETFNIALLLLYHFSLVSHFQPKQPNSEILCSNRSTINFKKTEKNTYFIDFLLVCSPVLRVDCGHGFNLSIFLAQSSCFMHFAQSKKKLSKI